MKVLITGGAGYVGSSLIPQLLAKGHTVTVMDTLLFGGDPILPFFRDPNFEFVKGDIRHADELKKVVKDKDVIIHLAAIVGYPACRKNPELAKTVNVDGTKTLSSLLSKDQLVIYASTGSNYGALDEICTEDSPLNPLSLYGETKTMAEKYLLENNTTIAFRFATGFGVSARLRLDLMINDFTYKAVSQGYLVVYEKSYKRTFIHVHDMGRAFVFGIENQKKMIGSIFNVGSDTMNYSKEEICTMINAQTNAYIHYAEVGKDADQRNYTVSYKKINDLGYQTTINAEQGIKELINSFKAVEFKTPYTNI